MAMTLPINALSLSANTDNPTQHVHLTTLHPLPPSVLVIIHRHNVSAAWKLQSLTTGVESYDSQVSPHKFMCRVSLLFRQSQKQSFISPDRPVFPYPLSKVPNDFTIMPQLTASVGFASICQLFNYLQSVYPCIILNATLPILTSQWNHPSPTTASFPMGAMIFVSDSLSLTVAQVWAQSVLKGDSQIQ